MRGEVLGVQFDRLTQRFDGEAVGLRLQQGPAQVEVTEGTVRPENRHHGGMLDSLVDPRLLLQAEPGEGPVEPDEVRVAIAGAAEEFPVRPYIAGPVHKLAIEIVENLDTEVH